MEDQAQSLGGVRNWKTHYDQGHVPKATFIPEGEEEVIQVSEGTKQLSRAALEGIVKLGGETLEPQSFPSEWQDSLWKSRRTVLNTALGEVLNRVRQADEASKLDCQLLALSLQDLSRELGNQFTIAIDREQDSRERENEPFFGDLRGASIDDRLKENILARRCHKIVFPGVQNDKLMETIDDDLRASTEVGWRSAFFYRLCGEAVDDSAGEPLHGPALRASSRMEHPSAAVEFPKSMTDVYAGCVTIASTKDDQATARAQQSELADRIHRASGWSAVMDVENGALSVTFTFLDELTRLNYQPSGEGMPDIVNRPGTVDPNNPDDPVIDYLLSINGHSKLPALLGHFPNQIKRAKDLSLPRDRASRLKQGSHPAYPSSH